MKKKRMVNFEEKTVVQLFTKAHRSYLLIKQNEREKQNKQNVYPIKRAA